MLSDAPQKSDQQRRRIFLAALIFVPLVLSFLNYVSFHQYPILGADVALVVAAFLVLSLVMLALPRRLIVLPIAAGALSFAILAYESVPIDNINGLIEPLAASVGADIKLPGKYYFAVLLLVALVLIGRFSASRHFQILIGLLLAGMFAAGAMQWISRGTVTDHFVSVKADGEAGPMTKASAAQGSPTLFLHIMLDEHQGIGQFPEDLPEAKRAKEAVIGFFDRFGFTVLPRTFVRHLDTEYSLADILNYDRAEESVSKLNGVVSIVSHRGGLRRTLLRNTAFERLRQRNYSLHVIQSNHLNLCTRQWTGMTCREYQWNTIRAMLDMPVPVLTRTAVLTSMWLKSVSVASWARNQLREKANLNIFVDPPTSLSAEFTLRTVAEEIESGDGRRAYFLHLMAPHGPYSYKDDCRFDPNPWNWHGEPEHHLTWLKRRYYVQVRCLYEQMTAFFTRLESRGHLKNAQVIMHGDHGSRLVAVPKFLTALEDAASAETLQDFRDNGFGTLMAYRRHADSVDESDANGYYFDVKSVVRSFYENEPLTPMPSQTSLQVLMHRSERARTLDGDQLIETGMEAFTFPLSP